MINVLFFGNCNIYAIYKILEPVLIEYKLEYIPCYSTNISENDFNNKILNSNIIFTQPINDKYRDVNFLSTNYILSSVNPCTKIFIMLSQHFDFYYFDYKYYYENEKMLQNLSHYHYLSLIQIVKDKKKLEDFVTLYYQNENLKSEKELLEIAEESILELKRREELLSEYNIKYPKLEIYHIKTSQFIQDNFCKYLLFYSINHPSKKLFEYIVNEILKKLNIFINNFTTDIDPLETSEKGILYFCLKKVLKFNIENYKPRLLKSCSNEIDKILKEYYLEYNKIFN